MNAKTVVDVHMQRNVCLLYTSRCVLETGEWACKAGGRKAEYRYKYKSDERTRNHFCYSCKPVSYTHLDVYKRQAL